MRRELPIVTPDKFHDECAVFGIYGHKEAANLTYLGLHALQHRGQESAGVVSNDDGTLHNVRAMGAVRKIFTRDEMSDDLAIVAPDLCATSGEERRIADLEHEAVSATLERFAFGRRVR